MLRFGVARTVGSLSKAPVCLPCAALMLVRSHTQTTPGSTESRDSRPWSHVPMTREDVILLAYEEAEALDAGKHAYSTSLRKRILTPDEIDKALPRRLAESDRAVPPEAAKDGEFPFYVAPQTIEELRYYCLSSVVEPEFSLTALSKYKPGARKEDSLPSWPFQGVMVDTNVENLAKDESAEHAPVSGTAMLTVVHHNGTPYIYVENVAKAFAKSLDANFLAVDAYDLPVTGGSVGGGEHHGGVVIDESPSHMGQRGWGKDPNMKLVFDPSKGIPGINAFAGAIGAIPPGGRSNKSSRGRKALTQHEQQRSGKQHSKKRPSHGQSSTLDESRTKISIGGIEFPYPFSSRNKSSAAAAGAQGAEQDESDSEEDRRNAAAAQRRDVLDLPLWEQDGYVEGQESQQLDSGELFRHHANTIFMSLVDTRDEEDRVRPSVLFVRNLQAIMNSEEHANEFAEELERARETGPIFVIGCRFTSQLPGAQEEQQESEEVPGQNFVMSWVGRLAKMDKVLNSGVSQSDDDSHAPVLGEHRLQAVQFYLPPPDNTALGVLTPPYVSRRPAFDALDTNTVDGNSSPDWRQESDQHNSAMASEAPGRDNETWLKDLLICESRGYLLKNHKLLTRMLRDAHLVYTPFIAVDGFDDREYGTAELARIISMAVGICLERTGATTGDHLQISNQDMSRALTLYLSQPDVVGAHQGKHLLINQTTGEVTMPRAKAVDSEALKSSLTSHEKNLLKTVTSKEEINVGFNDVGSLDDVKEKLQDLIRMPLVRPDLFATGILKEAISGILLFGPPGTGKTMLAKAVASESGANFMHVSFSDIMNKYVGEGEKNAKAVFTLARKLAPTVIFLDEIDSLLSSRDGGRGYTSKREVLNEFMSEWDGMAGHSDRVIVMGATNRPFDLDDAVLRRLPRRVMVNLPDAKARKDILRIVARKETFGADVDLDAIADRCEGYSGSDLKNLVMAAALQSAKSALDHEKTTGQRVTSREINMAHVEAAMKNLKRSVDPSKSLSMRELREWDQLYGEGTGKHIGHVKLGFSA
eukprot:Clim_evm66s11 gene=Clim_evmTU66s11